MSEDLSLNRECRRRRGIFSGFDDLDDSLLFFFLILVLLFTNCGSFGGIGDCDNDSSLLFFFLLLVIIFSGDGFF